MAPIIFPSRPAVLLRCELSRRSKGEPAQCAAAWARLELGMDKACTGRFCRGGVESSSLGGQGGQWPVSIVKEGAHGMLRRGTLDGEGGYEHCAQNHRGVAQSDNAHSKRTNSPGPRTSDLRRRIPNSRKLLER